MKYSAANFQQRPTRSPRAPSEAEAVEITGPSERAAEAIEPLAPPGTRPIHVPVLTISRKRNRVKVAV